MHSDTDTGADVTALALATIEQARDIHAAIPPENPFEAITLHGMRIAAAAVRLAMREGRTVLPSPWWANERRDHWYSCKVCYNEGQTIDQIQHDDDCPALELDAAIRAAGEAGHA